MKGGASGPLETTRQRYPRGTIDKAEFEIPHRYLAVQGD